MTSNTIGLDGLCRLAQQEVFDCLPAGSAHTRLGVGDKPVCLNEGIFQ